MNLNAEVGSHDRPGTFFAERMYAYSAAGSPVVVRRGARYAP